MRRVLGRPGRTLHHWRIQGWFEHLGYDSRGQLCRLGDVRVAALGITNGRKAATQRPAA